MHQVDKFYLISVLLIGLRINTFEAFSLANPFLVKMLEVILMEVVISSTKCTC